MRDETNKQPVILSVESSGNLCGAALGSGSEIIAEYYISGKNYHDKLLAEFIRRLLDDSGTAITDVNAVAVSSGPGSFTGLRIGASIAKGLCYGGHPGLIAVPTLSALAFAAHNSGVHCGRLIVLLPSHKDLLYCQVFGAFGRDLIAEDIINPPSEIEYISIKDFVDRITELPESPDEPHKIISGDTNLTGRIQNEFFNKVPVGNILLRTLPLLPRYCALLGYELYLQDKFVSAEEFVPLYLQEFKPVIGKK
jgi:tRNA threonylcarbamoyladenosine biosynthesis protein TsaB